MKAIVTAATIATGELFTGDFGKCEAKRFGLMAGARFSEVEAPRH